ncbi:MAG: YlmC/YmxH family sporulation protein [Ruminococcaceae bacterium]|nr:YlmC/YmxH family sporulation protein [Oscillospiraceae bacterium]
MTARLNELRYKEVISISGGMRLGYIDDVEMDVTTGKIISVTVPGKPRFLGIFGRCEEYTVPWEKIVRIGDDIILADYDIPIQSVFPEKNNFWTKLFK